MKIDKINQNYSAPRLQLKNYSAATKQHFTGSLKNEIMEELPDKVALKIMDKFKWLKGEIGGILITALGTGAVAPIFIAYNPFVKAPKGATKEQKEDVENTKKYTAMRQPVSAVLAVLIQTSILKPIDKGLEILFNNPNYAKNLWLALDQSTLNKSSYIEKQIKKDLKAQGKKFENQKVFQEEVNKLVKAKEAEQINTTALKLKETGKIHIGDRTVDNKTTAEVINKIIENYIEDAKNLKTSDKGLEFYKKRATMLVNNEETFKAIFEKLPKDEKEIANYLTKEISKRNNPDVETILNGIINTSEHFRASRCQRTLERIETIKTTCNGNFTPETYLGKMKETNKAIDEIIKKLNDAKITDFSNVTEEKIQSVIKTLANSCHYDESDYRLNKKFAETETFQSNTSELLKKIYKDITKGYKNVIEKRYKGFNQISKIAIGLCITLPISCTALNWVYPRFMDLFFPKLSGKKKDDSKKVENGGGK